jgi:hypothetical protein
MTGFRAGRSETPEARISGGPSGIQGDRRLGSSARSACEAFRHRLRPTLCDGPQARAETTLGALAHANTRRSPCHAPACPSLLLRTAARPPDAIPTPATGLSLCLCYGLGGLNGLLPPLQPSTGSPGLGTTALSPLLTKLYP